MMELISSKVVELKLLEPMQVAQNWPIIERELKRNLELIQDVFTPEIALARAISGNIQVWLLVEDRIARVLLLTQFYSSATTRVFQVFYASGHKLVAHFDVLLALEKFAIANGVDRVEVQGRKGFENLLKPLGYEVDFVTFKKNVTKLTEH